jgi:hypothetical protein
LAASIDTVTAYGLCQLRTGVSSDGLSLQNERQRINLKPRFAACVVGWSGLPSRIVELIERSSLS